MKAKSLTNSLLLFLAACIWGLAFISQSKGMEAMQPLTFNGIRSLLGGVVVLPVMLLRLKVRKRENAEKNIKSTGINWKITLTGGLLCGIFYTVASNLQQYGIMTTTVGKAGFITTLYIIFVPVLGIFLRKKVPSIVWLGATIAAAGMYLLCMTESFTLAYGDLLVFLCAILFAIHILIVDYYSPKTDGVILSCMQLLICGITSTIAAFMIERPTFSQIAQGYIPILYAGIMSCGVAYTLQIVGQKNVNPTIASLIFSLESVVAALSGYVAYKVGFLKTDQTLTARQIVGCAIVLMAVILVQLPIGKKNKK